MAPGRRGILPAMRGFVWVLAAALAASVPALADEPTPPTDAERALGREEFKKGLEHAGKGRWPEAAGAFQRAYELVRLPEILFNVAGAQAKSGLLVEAAETYRRFLREGTTEQAKRFRADAESFLAALEKRLPSLRLDADNFHEEDRLEIDGKPTSAAVLGRPLPLNPGKHRIAVKRGGKVVAEASVTLIEGKEEKLALDVPPLTPAEVAEEVVERDQPPPPPPPPAEGEGPRWWLWGSIGAGAVAVGVVVGYFLLRPDDEAPFDGNLGDPIRF